MTAWPTDRKAQTPQTPEPSDLINHSMRVWEQGAISQQWASYPGEAGMKLALLARYEGNLLMRVWEKQANSLWHHRDVMVTPEAIGGDKNLVKGETKEVAFNSDIGEKVMKQGVKGTIGAGGTDRRIETGESAPFLVSHVVLRPEHVVPVQLSPSSGHRQSDQKLTNVMWVTPGIRFPRCRSSAAVNGTEKYEQVPCLTAQLSFKPEMDVDWVNDDSHHRLDPDFALSLPELQLHLECCNFDPGHWGEVRGPETEIVGRPGGYWGFSESTEARSQTLSPVPALSPIDIWDWGLGEIHADSPLEWEHRLKQTIRRLAGIPPKVFAAWKLPVLDEMEPGKHYDRLQLCFGKHHQLINAARWYLEVVSSNTLL
ncbi:hypothetical protein C8J56DRAFT_891991 [Mycena floridula]|nr:hypothetical protein C8J56DRAFT_891991 [Mycena floridula]